MLVLPKGVRHIPGHLDRDEQASLVEDIRTVVRQAPLYRPEMPRSGKPFSVRMTNCGTLGWVADKAGYRYQDSHPVTGAPWPQIPDKLLSIWTDLTGESRPPQACLINFYDVSARMGLHQDRDESDFSAPPFCQSRWVTPACFALVAPSAGSQQNHSVLKAATLLSSAVKAALPSMASTGFTR
jgi:alkylated DNA repair protein (DNA oxidative demethylase)